ncbi:hypothetical protein [Brevundimonas sp.]|uniref:DUF3108 domain-containing protein n=1 Tax=Brevundimonas sp. TaxID=1871086 RepID=UPI002E11DFCA|nr:hypothetical protein [Brevundimonas sp.]
MALLAFTSGQDPDGALLMQGDACYALVVQDRVVGATRQTVREAVVDGRRVWEISIHQKADAWNFDMRDRIQVDAVDMRPIRYDSVRAASSTMPGQEVHLVYGADRVRGSKTLGETRTDIDVALDRPVWDGNLWGLTFSALPLAEGAELIVPVWQYDKGFGAFTVTVTGSRTVEGPAGTTEAWVLRATDGGRMTTEYLIDKQTRMELGYSAGPMVQRLGGDCSGMTPSE